MYEAFYSFRGMPFQLAPDGRFYFGSHEHKKAMAYLEYGIAQREGFVVITGEIGAGKTTLVEHLLETIDLDQFVVARVVTTQLGAYDALCMVASAFNVYDEDMDKSAVIGRLTKLFANLRTQEKFPLIIVDEAQSLSKEAIEEIRMLSNIVLGGGAPFQGILLGQPEFRAALANPDLQQFRQRIIASCHLGALNREDTRSYIVHRLRRVGWTNNPDIADEAFDEIYRRTGGIPRRINTLCSRLLLLGYLEESHSISAKNVTNVAEELNAEANPLETQQDQRAQENPIASNNLETSSGADFDLRMRRVERKVEKLDQVVSRGLKLALKYLPDGESK